MIDPFDAVPFTPDNADYFELTTEEVEIVSLVERRFSRAAIAAYWGQTPESIRDQVGGLCDFYRCPTSELPERVREVARARFEGAA